YRTRTQVESFVHRLYRWLLDDALVVGEVLHEERNLPAIEAHPGAGIGVEVSGSDVVLLLAHKAAMTRSRPLPVAADEDFSGRHRMETVVETEACVVLGHALHQIAF